MRDIRSDCSYHTRRFASVLSLPEKVDEKGICCRRCHERAQRVEWSHGESNPDLLNAIQPSSR